MKVILDPTKWAESKNPSIIECNGTFTLKKVFGQYFNDIQSMLQKKWNRSWPIYMHLCIFLECVKNSTLLKVLRIIWNLTGNFVKRLYWGWDISQCYRRVERFRTHDRPNTFFESCTQYPLVHGNKRWDRVKRNNISKNWLTEFPLCSQNSKTSLL